jgi:NNP family nitrate/nitrite transporter-like MFS transporter
MTKYRTLLLATVGFNFSFLIWFSFAPFTGPIAEEFGLTVAELGILASAAIWLAPFGRILTGWLSDRFGAPVVFAIVLAYVGVFSIWSAFAASYAVFFGTRLIVATAGITFVIGIQHVSEWFAESELGTAEGVYAGIGNAGAAAGALSSSRGSTTSSARRLGQRRNGGRQSRKRRFESGFSPPHDTALSCWRSHT